MSLRHALITCLFLLPAAAQADFQWSGTYRAEGIHINNSELNSNERKKEYGLHHLVLKPKMVLADGLELKGRLDIFNSNTYANSGLGDFFGGEAGSNTATCNATGQREGCLANGQTQSASMINVSQLYLNYKHEFGSLIVGRAPLQFGLGITHNAGEGLFDHWFDSRDLVAYKISAGNLSFIPMYGKLSEGDLQSNDGDIIDYMLQVGYENIESGLEAGAFYWLRKGDQNVSDAVSGTAADFEVETINLFVSKEVEEFKYSLEASMQTGDTGAQGIEYNGLALVAEIDYKPLDSKFEHKFGFGYISGDDTSTADEIEGYILDRNYDVAFLMFNHQLGSFDVLGTGRENGRGADGSDIGTPDIESISNAYYLDLNTTYHWTDKWSLDAGLTYASLVEDNGNDADLGFELDLGFTFSPNKKLKWVNQIGLLLPGKAFEQGGNFESEFAYGLSTKAAISF